MRRLRGRLAAPVTVWTAADADGHPAGLTVSSVLVAEGEPSSVLGLVGGLSELWDALRATRRFVVHVLDADQARLAEQFALRFPGDPFADHPTTASPWGPVLGAVATRANCTLVGFLEAGWSLLVRGVVDEVVVPDDGAEPLVHHRGRYLTARPSRGGHRGGPAPGAPAGGPG